MGKEKVYKVNVAIPAKKRYQNRVLPYLFDNFSLERATEIDQRILDAVATLSTLPGRGSKERYLVEINQNFKYILHKETKHFEIKIIYFVDEKNAVVNVIDFFPTRMNPIKIKGKY